MKPRVLVLSMLGLMTMAAGCGSTLSGIVGSTSTTQSGDSNSVATASTSTTTPLAGEVAVAFPVVACTTALGTAVAGPGWKPTILVAPIPTALAGKVEFFSDGTHIVLGPEGWSCVQSTTSQGGASLTVFPSDSPNPTLSGPPAPGDEGIYATFASTGTNPGVALVCPFFTVASWQQREADCPTTKPIGEQVSMPTPDVAAIDDPAGTTGSLEASGGSYPVSGVVIFPQVMPAVTDGDAIKVAAETCAVADTSLCPTVLSDFEVREFPVPTTTAAP